jgi:integrase
MAGVKQLPNGNYEAFYRDPNGKEKTKQEVKRKDAVDWLNKQIASLVRGDYVDPKAGKVKFQLTGDEWLANQTFNESTREAVEVRLRRHVYPTLGDKQLRQIRPSTIQAWLRRLELEGLAESYRSVIFANVSSIFSAAVDDEIIAKNPCRAPSVRAPKAKSPKIVPWTTERIYAVHDALPERFRIAETLGAGLGLRQGEVFGLSSEDVDFLRGAVHVNRQVKLLADGTLLFDLPKGRKSRTVPLPDSVRDELAAHLAAYPARPVTLPWAKRDGERVTVPLVLTTRVGNAVSRNYFNSKIWKPALEASGVPTTRANGTHALRHYFASVLLDAGESIKAVSEYLGHADAGFTLRTYTHLMPTSEDRARRAIDAVLTRPADYARTNSAVGD